jgi:hypothetical protein
MEELNMLSSRSKLNRIRDCTSGNNIGFDILSQRESWVYPNQFIGTFQEISKLFIRAIHVVSYSNIRLANTKILSQFCYE